MKLKYVTITGVDSFLAAGDCAQLSYRFPFVEWGFLLGKTSNGNRYMPVTQILRTAQATRDIFAGLNFMYPSRINMALHVCGKYCQELLSLAGEAPQLLATGTFNRVQLNTQLQQSNDDVNRLIDLTHAFPGVDFILQRTPSNEEFIDTYFSLRRLGGRRVPTQHVVHDHSGGNGKFGFDNGLPEPYRGVFYGYAGGINPSNIHTVVTAIEEAGPGISWIDMESGVRNDMDWMDFDKVIAILEACKPIAVI